MKNIFALANKFISKIAEDPKGQKLLKKYLGPEEGFENDVYKELVKRDIIPIMKGGKWNFSAFLGSGAYSMAYEVSYKGKLAVAKVTRSAQDYDAMISLESMRNALGRYKKHIAKVYDHFEFKNENSRSPTYVIIVEKLEPLSSHLRNVIFNAQRFGEEKRYSFVPFKDKDVFEYIEKINTYANKHPLMGALKGPLQLEFLEKMNTAFKYAFENSNSISELKNTFLNRLTAIKREIYTKIISRNNNEEDALVTKMGNALYELCSDIVSYVFDLFKYPYFPTEYRHNSDESFLEMPETESFMNFLYELEDRYNIQWYDLHGSNIMMRPSTGDLVVSDPGLFDFGEQDEY